MKMFLNFATLSICLLMATESFAQTRPLGQGKITYVPGNAAPAQGHVVGGWSPFQAVDREAQHLFHKAFEQHVGTRLTPYCVSKQVVAGTNYRFFCFSTAATNPPKTENAVVDIHVDPQGNIKEKKIHSIPRQGLAGGWSEFKPLDEKAKEVFAATLGKLQGVGYTPLCVSTQVVAGLNYRFFCSTHAATNPPKTANALGVVYADLQGNKKITEVKEFAASDLPQLLQGERPQEGASPMPVGNNIRFQNAHPQGGGVSAPIRKHVVNERMR